MALTGFGQRFWALSRWPPFYLALLIGRFGFLLSLAAIFVSFAVLRYFTRLCEFNLTRLVRW
jgi:hypothetical protein